jgi:hypothetical protein
VTQGQLENGYPETAVLTQPCTRPTTRRGHVGAMPYYVAVADPRRDEFPDNYVGDLVPTERRWVVVPPTACPAGYASGLLFLN